MTTHRSLAAALWLLAGVVAFAVCSSWAGEAQSGKLSPWALVAFFWGAAAVSVAIHYLSQGPEALRRYRLSRRPSPQVPRFSVEVWRPTVASIRACRLAVLTPFSAFVRGHGLAPLAQFFTSIRTHWLAASARR
jgi:hypothetical protein